MPQIAPIGLMAFDIGSRKHEFVVNCADQIQTGEVTNNPAELRRFLKRTMKKTMSWRLIVEATGLYFLDLALIASELGAEVMVVNPKAAHNFAKALQRRNKTDRLDALMLLEFLKRMPFVAWQPPARGLLELRQVGRYLVQLSEECTAAKNRLHALSSTQACPTFLRTDLKRGIAALDKRITKIRAKGLALIAQNPSLLAAFNALKSIKGIGETTALSVLGELSVLPRSLNARACVCHAGLDVRVHQSGSSVNKPGRLTKHGNKYLRRALFLPALTAGTHDPHARAFKERLLGRGKKKMQANAAIMRKMLTVAWALVREPQTYDGSKLYAELS